MAKNDEIQDSLQHDLWLASTKLRGLSELISFFDREASALDDSECLYGIGAILREIGEKLAALSKEIDEQEVKRKQKGKKNVKREK